MKHKIIVRVLLLAIFTLTVLLPKAQFLVGHTPLTFTDSARNNRNIPVHVYYPASDTAVNAAFANGSFPVLVFGHGILMEWFVYSNVWNYLVPNGYIVASIGTETTFGANFNNFGMDEAFVAKVLEEESGKPASFFYNHVESIATGGHSMGGSAAILSANKNSHIRTIVGLAPSAESVNTSYSMPDTAATLTIPALVFAATGDGMAAPATHQQPIYDSLKGSCKVLITITGGNHCQFAEPHNLCQTAEAGLGGSATISRAAQHAIVDRYLLPWLNYTLKGDAVAWNNAITALVSDNEVTYSMSCGALGIDDRQKEPHAGVRVYMDGITSQWVIEAQDNWKDARVEILDITGRMVQQLDIKNFKTSLSLEGPCGLYILRVSKGDKSATFKVVKNAF